MLLFRSSFLAFIFLFLIVGVFFPSTLLLFKNYIPVFLGLVMFLMGMTLELTDFKVRILSSEKGTDAIVRVLIETKDQKGSIWTTVGVSTNIIDASYNALRESLIYKLIKSS